MQLSKFPSKAVFLYLSSIAYFINMFKYTKNKEEPSMHKWLSTGSILLPYDLQDDSLTENIPYIDDDNEKEIKFLENDHIWNQKKNGFKLLKKSTKKQSKYRDSLKILFPWRHSGSGMAIKTYVEGIFSWY